VHELVAAREIATGEGSEIEGHSIENIHSTQAGHVEIDLRDKPAEVRESVTEGVADVVDDDLDDAAEDGDGELSLDLTLIEADGDDNALPPELAWQERALCAQTDPEAFFPEKGGSTREAKRVCMSCEVRAECLEYALAKDERFGIWGGLSERERRRVKKQAV
jgi:WhiB family redox-sensing transcriptional regulator